jgi:hypothetical protein
MEHLNASDILLPNAANSASLAASEGNEHARILVTIVATIAARIM